MNKIIGLKTMHSGYLYYLVVYIISTLCLKTFKFFQLKPINWNYYISYIFVTTFTDSLLSMDTTNLCVHGKYITLKKS